MQIHLILLHADLLLQLFQYFDHCLRCRRDAVTVSLRCGI